jgi:hypothetical protein
MTEGTVVGKNRGYNSSKVSPQRCSGKLRRTNAVPSRRSGACRGSSPRPCPTSFSSREGHITEDKRKTEVRIMARTAFDAGVRATSPVTTASAVIVLPTRPPMAHPSRRLAAAEPAAPSGRHLFGTRLTPAAASMPSSALRRCSSQPHRQPSVGDHNRGPRPCSSERVPSAGPRGCSSPRQRQLLSAAVHAAWRRSTSLSSRHRRNWDEVFYCCRSFIGNSREKDWGILSLR